MQVVMVLMDWIWNVSMWSIRDGIIMTYCCETLPGQKVSQSTLPFPGFHSSPKIFRNSSSVIPGGKRRMTIFSP